MQPACSKECKYYIFRQYWYTRNVPVFTNTGTFQYLGPEEYFFRRVHSCKDSPGQICKFVHWHSPFSQRFSYKQICKNPGRFLQTFNICTQMKWRGIPEILINSGCKNLNGFFVFSTNSNLGIAQHFFFFFFLEGFYCFGYFCHKPSSCEYKILKKYSVSSEEEWMLMYVINHGVMVKGVLHLLPKISMFCDLSQNNHHFLEK